MPCQLVARVSKVREDCETICFEQLILKRQDSEDNHFGEVINAIHLSAALNIEFQCYYLTIIISHSST